MSRRRWILLAVVGLPLLYLAYVAWGLPDRAEVRALAKHVPLPTGVMRQREQQAREQKRNLRRVQITVPLARVSRHLIHAVVTAEDPKFFGHEGVDWEAMRESLETDIKKRSFARGGSTITQQLAKNVFYSTRKSIARKLREFVVARWMEEDLSKRRILEIYLNVIEWGEGVYGCEAAARRYYGKSAAELNEIEAAGLAAMIPSPRRINPRVNAARHARAQKRILWLMARAGYVKRDVGALGSEPPVEVDDESEVEPVEADAPAPPQSGAPPSSPEPATPPTEATPSDAGEATATPPSPAP